MKKLILTTILICSFSTLLIAQSSNNTIYTLGIKSRYDSAYGYARITFLLKDKYFEESTLQPGDLIKNLNDKPFNNYTMSELRPLFNSKEPGKVKIDIIRNNSELKTFNVDRTMVDMASKPATWGSSPGVMSVEESLQLVVSAYNKLNKVCGDSIPTNEFEKNMATEDNFYSVLIPKGAYESYITHQHIKTKPDNLEWRANFIRTANKAEAEKIYTELKEKLKHIKYSRLAMDNGEAQITTSQKEYSFIVTGDNTETDKDRKSTVVKLIFYTAGDYNVSITVSGFKEKNN